MWPFHRKRKVNNPTTQVSTEPEEIKPPEEVNNPTTQVSTEPEEIKPPEIMALANYFSYAIPSYLGDGGLDSADDKTYINWLSLQGNDLEKAITEYISFKPRVNTYKEMRLDWRAWCILRWFACDECKTFFIVNSSECLPKDKTTFERLKNVAIENSIRIVEKVSKGIYHDFVEEKYYCLEVYETWPGIVDDAATYGAYHIREITKNEALQ